LAQLRAAGAQVDDRVEDYDFGRFGWATDPEGNLPSAHSMVERAKTKSTPVTKPRSMCPTRGVAWPTFELDTRLVLRVKQFCDNVFHCLWSLGRLNFDHAI
jgi:hypothetical protein